MKVFFEFKAMVSNDYFANPYNPYDHYCGYRLHSYGGGNEKAIDLWLWYRHQLPKLYHDSNQNYQSFLEKNGHHYIENMKDQKFKELIEMRGRLWT